MNYNKNENVRGYMPLSLIWILLLLEFMNTNSMIKKISMHFLSFICQT